MATKLKNLSLTSVDLVRAGANQEADICLHKSADGTEEPTERETNILKRFINWLKENPTEGDQEPENTIEKADEEQESAEVCKSAICESIKSIIADDSLTVEERSAMIEKSLGQYHDKMVELAKAHHVEETPAPQVEESKPTDIEKGDIVEVLDVEKADIVEVEVVKFNPYHGKDGRFASANGYATFTYAPGKSKAHDLAIQREKDRQAAAGGGAKQEPEALSPEQWQEKHEKRLSALKGSPTFSKPLVYDGDDFYYEVSKHKANSYGDIAYSGYFRSKKYNEGYYQCNLQWKLKDAKKYVRDRIEGWEDRHPGE